MSTASTTASQPDSSKPPARAKSPPLAFEKTPNDMLISPSIRAFHSADGGLTSPSASIMGRLSPGDGSEQHLQVIVDQQANAIQLLHEAFAAERQVWSLERERLHQRIANLERLLKNGDHHSPAKSPVISPSWGSGLASPQPRSLAASHILPTIAEDDKSSLSFRRAGAPRSIDLPSMPQINEAPVERRHTVAFTTADGVKVEEIPASPARLEVLSPPPATHRAMAGHTPVRVPRKPTPPPQKMSIDGIEDTPTRNNTSINAFLTQCNDEDNDRALNGPLNMPELPSKPSDTNFTLEALSRRLEQIEHDPEQSKPLIFATPSPGLASPHDEIKTLGSDQVSPRTLEKSIEAPFAPAGTRDATASQQSSAVSHHDSPSVSAMSPNGVPPLDSAEVEIFEAGGIKLKKKTSINFGAPFGQLGGFSALRKMS